MGHRTPLNPAGALLGHTARICRTVRVIGTRTHNKYAYNPYIYTTFIYQEKEALTFYISI